MKESHAMTELSVSQLFDSLLLLWAGVYLLWALTGLVQISRGLLINSLLVSPIFWVGVPVIGIVLAYLYYTVVFGEPSPKMLFGLGVFETVNLWALFGFAVSTAQLSFHWHVEGGGEFLTALITILVAIGLITRSRIAYPGEPE